MISATDSRLAGGGQNRLAIRRGVSSRQNAIADQSGPLFLISNQKHES